MDYSMQTEFEIETESLQRFLQSNILLYCVVALLILKIAAMGVSINFPNNIFFADITKTALQNFVNETRQSLGLNSLLESQKLDQAARLKAEDMVKNQYFQHTSPQGITPWFWFSKTGYNYKYAGENLAIGFFESNEVFQAWLNSASHKANLLNPNYKEVGTAVLDGYGQNNTIVVVQLFGTEQTQKTAAPAQNNTVNPPVAQPAPAETVEPAQTEPVNTPEKVLSQTTEPILAPIQNASADNPYSRFLNSILYNSENVVQNITFGLSLIIIGALIFVIFSSFNTPFKGALIFRSLILIIVLSTSLLISKEMIISIIPHQIII